MSGNVRAFIQPDATVREVLDALDAYFVDSRTANELWHVLSALRGPDVREAGDKEWTCVIRSAAFPLASKQRERLTYPEFASAAGVDALRAVCREAMLAPGHFSGHVCDAAHVLTCGE